MKLRTLAEARKHLGLTGAHGDVDDEGAEYASRLIAQRSDAIRQIGWKVREWRPSKVGPAAERHGSVWDWDFSLTEGWLDHPYCLVTNTGQIIYVSEPYGLSGDVWGRFSKLVEQGWDVAVRPANTLHYPGRTVAVWLRRS